MKTETTAQAERYTPPFSPRYQENQAKCTGAETPCFICGKPVKRGQYYVRTVYGAEICTNEFAEAHPGGDTGFYPIGPECYRKLPQDARSFVTREVE